MSSDRSKLSTTSYAVLGLLAIKPWTSYELTRQMGRGIDRLWPRSRSKLFEEPKKLVAHGLARAEPGQVGRRPRTVYSITDVGRRALAAWLATASQPPAMESEHLLKVFFAEHGTKRDLEATITALRDWAAADMAHHASVARSYLAGLGPFPHRAALLALTARYLADLAAMTHAWATSTLRTIEDWPDDLAAEPDWTTLRQIADLAGSATPAPRSPDEAANR